MSEERKEFNFTRTHCACDECRINCEHLPGYLIPADLPRISAALGYGTNLFSFGLKFLRASPGATVRKNGKVFQIPTLVPARRDEISNTCIFLSPDGRCRIHQVSPFGCAYFDCHQTPAESNERSARGLTEINRAWQNGDVYSLLWRVLRILGRVTRPAEIARAEIRERISGRHASRKPTNTNIRCHETG